MYAELSLPDKEFDFTIVLNRSFEAFVAPKSCFDLTIFENPNFPETTAINARTQ